LVVGVQDEEEGFGQSAISQFSVRRAKKSDMKAISEMVSLLFPEGSARHLHSDRYLIAERFGIPVGFCHFRLREKKCYIAGLGVLPQYRNHGVGSQLMAEALNYIDRHGGQTTFLKVRALNSAAGLYLKYGFFEKRSGDVLVLVRKRPS
jgi:ribosomal protein S18 acetylase RimI-like enzyme